MSLAKANNSELEKLFYEFMNYYYYNKKWKDKHNKPPYDYDHDYDHDHDHDHHYPNHNHHDNHHNHKGNNKSDNYYKPPYTTLPYPKPKRYAENIGASRVEILEPSQNCDENVTYPTVFKPTPEYYESSDMVERVDKEMLKDENYYKALFTNINKMFMPYVEQVIKNNNYEGSPINDKYFDRESLAQIVDEVIQRAKNNKQLAEFINDVDPKVRQLIKNIAQALVLGELFVVHRPNTKLNEGNMINEDQKPYYMQQKATEKVVKTKPFDNYAGETQRF